MAQMPHWMPNGAATMGTTHTSANTASSALSSAAGLAPATNRHVVRITHSACPTATLGPSKDITYTDIMVKKYQPNRANNQLPSSSTTAAMATSADATNASENERDGQGRKHHARPHAICRTANIAIATPATELLANGCSNTSEAMPSSPVPMPIATWIVLAIERLVKYCTWFA